MRRICKKLEKMYIKILLSENFEKFRLHMNSNLEVLLKTIQCLQGSILLFKVTFRYLSQNSTEKNCWPSLKPWSCFCGKLLLHEISFASHNKEVNHPWFHLKHFNSVVTDKAVDFGKEQFELFCQTNFY